MRRRPLTALAHASKEEQLRAIKENGSNIFYITDPDEELQLAAVTETPYAIAHIKNNLITPVVKRALLNTVLLCIKDHLKQHHAIEIYKILRERKLPWPEIDTIEQILKAKGMITESVIQQTSEVDAMRKMKIMTQIDIDESEGLYNTTVDRWSRRAKHHLSKSDIANAIETSDFYEGENAFYKGKQVEVRIPIGPNGTAGIMLEGHLRMVDRKDLSRLDEGVMGGLKPLTPINRIMQLAGLEHTGVVVSEEEVMEANESGTLFNQLYQKNVTGEFKNNPDAAKTATIGQILASMQSLIEQLPEELGLVDKAQLKAVPGIGASLISHAKKMIQPRPPGGTE